MGVRPGKKRPFARATRSRKGNRAMPSEPAAQAKLTGLESHGSIIFHSVGLIVVARQGVHRERIAVQVVLQVENRRETGAREIVLAPRTIVILLKDKVRNRFGDGRIVDI